MVQASGDAHLSNFGLFASPERTMVFDTNDFVGALRDPAENSDSVAWSEGQCLEHQRVERAVQAVRGGHDGIEVAVGKALYPGCLG